MIDSVRFTKKGLVIIRPDRNGKDVFEEQVGADAVSLLRCTCEIEEGVTLADVMTEVKHRLSLTDLMRRYSWCRTIRVFHKALNKPFDKSRTSDLSHLLIEWNSHIAPDRNFVMWPTFVAVDGSGEKFGIDMHPLETYAWLPVRLNKALRIDNHESHGHFEVMTDFTLLDVLDALYWRISFHGGPKENAQFLEQLNATIAALKNSEPFEGTVH